MITQPASFVLSLIPFFCKIVGVMHNVASCEALASELGIITWAIPIASVSYCVIMFSNVLK